MSQDIRTILAAAIAFSSEPLVLTDPSLPDNPLIAVNDAFLRMTQYTRDEVLQRNCRFLQGAETDRATAARIARRVADGGGCIEWLVNYRKDGTMFWNLLFISPVHDDSGKIIAFLGNQLNITNGIPAWVGDVRRGHAEMPQPVREGFQALLRELAAEMTASPQANTTGLDEARLRHMARRLSILATRLDPPILQAG
jgi:PAS domain S-box-containing protein